MTESRPGGAATSIVLMVRAMGGAMFSVACSAADTFGDVKHRLYERGGPPPALQVLLWGGVEADDYQCVSEVEQRREPLVLATQAPRGLPMMSSPHHNGHGGGSPSTATVIVRSSADLSLAICGAKGCGKSAILSYVVGHISGTRIPQRHLVIAGQDFDVDVQECPRPMLAPGTTGFAQRLARSTSIMMLFDVSNAKSFEELQRYYDEIPRLPPLILVGNKIDEEADYMLRWEQRTHFPLFSSLERYLESVLADPSLVMDSSCLIIADPITNHGHHQHHHHHMLPASASSTVTRATPIAVPSSTLSSYITSSSPSPGHHASHLLMSGASGTSNSPGAWLSSSPHMAHIATGHSSHHHSNNGTNGGMNGHHHITSTSTSIGSPSAATPLSSSPAGASSHHISHPSHTRRNSGGNSQPSSHATTATIATNNGTSGSPPGTVTHHTPQLPSSSSPPKPHVVYCLPAPIISVVLEYFLTPIPHVGGREVSREEALTLARRWRVPYIEMSCKTQLGVRTALTLLLAQAMIACGHAITPAQIAQSLQSQLVGHTSNLMLNSTSGHALAAAVAGWPHLSLSIPSHVSGSHPPSLGSPLLSGQPLMMSGSPSNHNNNNGGVSHLSVRIPSSSGDGTFSPLQSPHYSNERSAMTPAAAMMPTPPLTSRVDARPAAPKVPKKVMWVPDSKTNECMKCRAAFHVFLRRHHCRLCGLIFCYACSQNRVNGSRVCDFCYR